MKKNLKLISLVLVLFIIPFISAADCPQGWICGSDGVLINIIEGYYCPNNDAWIDSDGGGVFSTIAVDDDPVFNCFDPYEGPSCCPSGSTCLQGGDVLELPNFPYQDYSCQASLNSFCSDFTEEDACEGATSEIAKASIEPGKGEGYCGSITNVVTNGETCWDEIACECVWGEDNDGEDICAIKSNETRACTDDSSTPIETCEYDMTPTYSCDVSGFINMNWELVSSDPAGVCEDIPQTQIPCTDVAKLGFFNLVNMLIALMLIFGYYVYDFKKE